MPNPKGSRRLRRRRPTEESEGESQAGEAEKNESDGKREERANGRREGGREGRASLDIDTYPAIKLMNLIRPD